MEVVDSLNQSIAPYKKILRFHITSSDFPKPGGKIKRYLLPELAGARKLVKQDEPRTREYLAIKKFLEDETQQEVNPGDHLELDLALDSLGRVSLSAFIETAFGVDIPESSLADFQSVAFLAEQVHLKKTRLNFEGIRWSQILKEKVHLDLPESWFTHNLIKNFLQVGFRMFMRIKTGGIENLPDEACIIAPNHQSVLDGFLVASLLKRKIIKKTYVYAKEKHFRGPFLRFWQSQQHHLGRREQGLKLSIQKLGRVLKKGKNLMISRKAPVR
jgi:long-chain acyl-CoA synthetase